MIHNCRTCGIEFDCGYGICSSENEDIDCGLCLKDYIKMGKVGDLI